MIIGTAAMTIALTMATLAFNNATYDINATTLAKIENQEMKTALTALEGESYNSQKEMFAAVALY